MDYKELEDFTQGLIPKAIKDIQKQMESYKNIIPSHIELPEIIVNTPTTDDFRSPIDELANQSAEQHKKSIEIHEAVLKELKTVNKSNDKSTIVSLAACILAGISLIIVILSSQLSNLTQVISVIGTVLVELIVLLYQVNPRRKDRK